jgi:DNA-binding transcriptional LysR family regulator
MTTDTRLLAGAGTFVTVVEAGSFSRAGDTLGLTQSGVSRAIARLESKLGIRLLQRHGRAITLTDEGERFYQEVRVLVAGIDDAAKMASGAALEVFGRLRVCVDMPFGHFMLAPKMADFMTAHPGVHVELVMREQIGDLVADGFDVAVRFGKPDISGLVARKLSETRIMTCASPGYVAERGMPDSPPDLVKDGHECILFRDPKTGRPYAWDYMRGGEAIRVGVSGRLVVTEPTSLLLSCVAGQGVAQLLSLYCGDYVERKQLLQLLTDWSDERWPLYAYLPTRRHPPAKVRAFLDYVVGLTREQQSVALLRGQPRVEAPAALPL